jgi:hypothetical protein
MSTYRVDVAKARCPSRFPRGLVLPGARAFRRASSLSAGDARSSGASASLSLRRPLLKGTRAWVSLRRTRVSLRSARVSLRSARVSLRRTLVKDARARVSLRRTLLKDARALVSLRRTSPDVVRGRWRCQDFRVSGLLRVTLGGVLQNGSEIDSSHSSTFSQA